MIHLLHLYDLLLAALLHDLVRIDALHPVQTVTTARCTAKAGGLLRRQMHCIDVESSVQGTSVRPFRDAKAFRLR